MLELARSYRNGEDVRDLLITSNIPLALSIASVYARRDRKRADDYGGDAMLELIEAVDAYKDKGYDDNIRAYIHFRIWWKLKYVAFEDRLIKVPHTTAKKKFAKGTFERFDSVQDIEPLLRLDTTKIRSIMVDDNTLEIDDEDIRLIELSVQEDRELIELRLQGCTDDEIARAMNLEPRYVSRRRNEIMSKLNLIYRRLENGNRRFSPAA